MHPDIKYTTVTDDQLNNEEATIATHLSIQELAVPLRIC